MNYIFKKSVKILRYVTEVFITDVHGKLEPGASIYSLNRIFNILVIAIAATLKDNPKC